MEIDARKTSSEFLLNLANNQQLYPSLQKQLKNYIFYNLEDSLVLMDSGKHLLKQLNYQAKKFKKEFEGCPLADAILQEYNSIMPSIKAYTTELNNFAFGLDVQIDNIKHQDMATLQLVKMQPNH